MSKISINTETGCWEWGGYISPKGYAKITHKKRSVIGSRFMYELIYGDVPKGLVVDHICNVRNCLNPKHLRAITNKENYMRSDKFGDSTHCPHGHNLNETGVELDWRGSRRCSECRRIYFREYYKKNPNKSKDYYQRNITKLQAKSRERARLKRLKDSYKKLINYKGEKK